MIPDHPSDPESRLLDLPSGRIAVTDVGDGPPLIAVHGLPGSARDYRYLGAMVEGPLRCVRVDLPAFGDSPPGDPLLEGFDGMVRAVVEVMDHLQIGHAALLGHSYGAMVATALAVWHPARVAGLALLASPGLRPHRGARSILRIRPALGVLLGQRHLRRAMMPLLRRAFVSAGFSSRWSDDRMVRSVLSVERQVLAGHAARLRRVEAPTLVAWTRDDPMVEAEIDAEAAAILPDGPRLEFPDGGHNLQKTRAVEIGNALLDWVPDL